MAADFAVAAEHDAALPSDDEGGVLDDSDTPEDLTSTRAHAALTWDYADLGCTNDVAALVHEGEMRFTCCSGLSQAK